MDLFVVVGVVVGGGAVGIAAVVAVGVVLVVVGDKCNCCR